MVKNKTFKNYKSLCKFVDAITIRVKRRFNHLALYFYIGENNYLTYFQIYKDKPINCSNLDWVHSLKTHENKSYL